MQNLTELRGRVQQRTRAARALLAAKGGGHWTATEQATFDVLMDDAEEAQGALDLLQMRASSPRVVARQVHRNGVEIFIRKAPDAYSAADAAKVRNAMSGTVGTEGGYTVQPLVAAEFVDTLKGYGWMRQVASQVTTGNGADLGFPGSDGSSEVGEALAQNAPASMQDPAFNTHALTAYKVGSKVFTVPIELLQDSQIDIVAFVLARARARIGRKQNQQFTTGSGAGEPTGLVTAASVGKIGATGQTATILYDDLVDVADSVDAGALGMPDTQADDPLTAPGWMFSQSMRKVVRKVKDSSGRPIWNPCYDDSAGSSGTPVADLMGYPVYINNDMPAPAANAKSLAFGNLRSYLVRDVLSLQLYRFDDSAFLLKGQVGFMAVARAGGNLLDNTAVKVYQHSAT